MPPTEHGFDIISLDLTRARDFDWILLVFVAAVPEP
jgi:hypothetical protein